MATESARCPQCGAMSSVPATGLEMRCEYCGLTQPVPDADDRRREIALEERRRRAAAEKAQEAAERKEQQRAEARRERRGAFLGGVRSLYLTLLPLAIVAVVLYSNGMFDSVLGDPGGEAFARAAREVRDKGYEAVGPASVERVWGGPASLNLSLERGYCYAIVIGAGRPIASVQLFAARTVSQAARETQATLVHCPEAARLARVAVMLDGKGRFTWGVFRRQAPVTREAPAARTPPAVETQPAPGRKRQRLRGRNRRPPGPPAEGDGQ